MRIGIVQPSLVVSQGSERGALLEVVGNNGFYVSYGDEKTTAEAIKKARERTKDIFSMKGRDKELLEVINKVLICKFQ